MLLISWQRLEAVHSLVTSLQRLRYLRMQHMIRQTMVPRLIGVSLLQLNNKGSLSNGSFR